MGAMGEMGEMGETFRVAPTFGMQGCVPLIVKVRWEEDAANGGTLEQPFSEVIPWNAIAHVELTRHDIPNLPNLLAAFPAERHAAMRRAAACVWPRLFWLPLPTGRGVDAADHAVEAPASVSGTDCQEELRALQPHDAFGTLMMTLNQRLKFRQQPSSSTLPARSAARVAATILGDAATEEAAATRWSRLEADWSLARSVKRPLRTAAWRTPAMSCQRALSMEQ